MNDEATPTIEVVEEKPKQKRTRKPKPPETMEVLLLKGYTPVNAEVVSYGQIPGRRIGNGGFEYEQVPGTLAKHPKGADVELPIEEAEDVIRKGIACIKRHANPSQLIQAGLRSRGDTGAEELV